MSILVTGGNGFIGHALGRAGLNTIPHDGAVPDQSIGCLIHAGRDPALGTSDYSLENDCELAWANWAKRQGCRFVHLGSRRVYAASSQPLDETSPIGPVDPYGQQKWAMEKRLRVLLGDQLLVLRIANIFGFELGRRSFFGAMLDSLLNYRLISFDMSGQIERDFLPVETLAEIIKQLAPKAGINLVNVGSGIATQTGELAKSVIHGYGQGKLVIADDRMHDNFVLNVTQMTNLTGIGTTKTTILAEAERIGRQLRQLRWQKP